MVGSNAQQFHDSDSAHLSGGCRGRGILLIVVRLALGTTLPAAARWKPCPLALQPISLAMAAVAKPAPIKRHEKGAQSQARSSLCSDLWMERRRRQAGAGAQAGPLAGAAGIPPTGSYGR